ncbi:MAG: type II CAAX endopeptidase family protein [Pseudomonadota bacterium]
MQYEAHDAFIAPARTRPEIWRLLLGLVLCFVVYVFGFAVLFGILVLYSGLEGAAAWTARMASEGTPTSTLLILATFVGMALGPFLAVPLLHGRSVGSLFGPLRLALRDFLTAMVICGTLYAVLLLVPTGDRPVPNLDLSLWALFVPLALVGILVQTGAEEVLFRGYLQQQLAARFASPVVWMVLPGVLFALGHYQPDIMGDNAWFIVLAVGLFAILAADLTAVTGNIGAAWGFHFANNCVGILIVGLAGPLSGLALYTSPFDPANVTDMRPYIFFDMVVTVVTWGLIRYAVTRRLRD